MTSRMTSEGMSWAMPRAVSHAMSDGGTDVTSRATAPHVIVNGEPRSLAGTAAHTTALDWLRGIGLTGAKEGCAEGECGACSVLVARPDGASGTSWTAVNACLLPALSFDGQEVVTAEGLGRPGHLHPVQREMASRGGSQCGYCTPGFVCSMAAEFYRGDRAPASGDPAQPAQPAQPSDSADSTRSSDSTDQDGHERGPNDFDLHALSGNLCRCTGYRPIRDAAYALGSPDARDPLAQRRAQPAPGPAPTVVGAPDGEFVRPLTLAEAVGILADRPDATVVAGCTDWGVEVNLRGARARLTVAVDRVPELRTLEVRDDVVEIGAALSLSELERGLAGRVPLLEAVIPQFASRLIRNGATLGGNLASASPIGDTAPALLALEAQVVLTSRSGARTVPLTSFFTGYRTCDLRPDELIRAVRVPRPLAGMTAFHKVAKRRFDDISGVAVAVAADVVDGVVTRAAIGLGGVAATPVRARATEEALVGSPWDRSTVTRAAARLRLEGTPMDDHRASAPYRSAMLGQALLRLHAENPRGEPGGRQTEGVPA
jgi:xanthine dehydrogenase small subunit